MSMIASPYEGMADGFGAASWSHIAELQKALETGTALSGQTGGNALQLQSLDASLKVLTHQDKQIVMWRDIAKTKAFSTVEEYTQLSEYGDLRGNPFVDQGELPGTQDSTYARQAAYVKFLGTTRSVSHQMTLVRTIGGDPITRENTNGILWLLRQMETSLFFGDSKLGVNGTEWVEFDGLSKQIDSGNVIDLAGGVLDERAIRNGAQKVLDAYGTPTHLYGSPQPLEDFAKTYIPNYRVPVQNGDGTFTAGFAIDKVGTMAGQIQLRGDVFLRPFAGPPDAATNANAPTALASAVATKSGGSDGGAWTKSSTSGIANVTYKVTLSNKYGESAPVTSSATSMSSSDALKSIGVVLTNASTIAIPGVYANIYRSDAGGAYSRVARIPLSSAAAGATTTFTDRNARLPGTYHMFLGEQTPEVFEFKQLLDLCKMDLAVTGPAYRWMLLLYGVPILYAPKKWVKYVNVGTAS